MVIVAQSVEPRIVIPVVAGSSPVVHPILAYPQERICRVARLSFKMQP